MALFRCGGGTDTSDANATAADILLNKTAYVDDEKITGSMANLGDISHTIGAGEVYNVLAGYTSGGVITAIAAGATITVTYTSDFYNKTMTCTKGQTTYTQTTTSSGSTTFSVAESGTWTITCNGVSRTVDVVLEYSTQMAITKTVTVYSAASDTVSFTDITGAKTVTTDANGEGSVSISFIPNSTITFTSSYAKSLSDVTQAYSKTITMTSNITSIYVMPDKTIFWYGYGNYENVEDNGWGGVSKLTRSIQASGGSASGGLRYIRFNLINPQNTSGETVCKMYAKVSIPQVYSDGTPNLQWDVVTTPPISSGTRITSLDGVTQIDISSYSDTRYAAFYLCNNSHGQGSISVEIYAVCFE